ncbi:hypothetical protein JCM15519_04100 [Fundidesulfovibrio butyratiphilus]
MLANEIQTVNQALGTLVQRVDPETRSVLRLCRERLDATADLADELEAQVIAARALENANRKASRHWRPLQREDGTR